MQDFFSVHEMNLANIRMQKKVARSIQSHQCRPMFSRLFCKNKSRWKEDLVVVSEDKECLEAKHLLLREACRVLPPQLSLPCSGGRSGGGPDGGCGGQERAYIRGGSLIHTYKKSL